VRAAVNREDGFTLIELLVAMTLMIILLSAVLVGLQTMQAQGSRNTKLQESMQAARLGTDTLASDLRNLASPTPYSPAALDGAWSNNLVFQVISKTGATSATNPANVLRVRYCLDSSTPKKLWKQTQVWGNATPAVPATAAETSMDPAAATYKCPMTANLGATGSATGWTTSKQMATNIVNNAAVDKLFTYNSTTLSNITQVSVDMVIDVNSTTRPPASVALTTGVFLRNQNRSPAAQWSFQKTASKKYRFNATPSTDPEGNPLNYYWYLGASPTCPLPAGFTPPAGSDIASIRNVAIPDYTFAATGTQRIVLVVADTGGLTSCSDQSINVS
jgi:prepilin-type N-terminal cleavage/methylation domain-containing protein